MDLAEAMLRPVDDDAPARVGEAHLERANTRIAGAGIPSTGIPRGVDRARSVRVQDIRLTEPLFGTEPQLPTEPWLATEPPAAHPHRRPPRIDRSRRPGSVRLPSQPCTAPLPARAAAPRPSAAGTTSPPR
jgi:hypothetical protein